MAIYNFLSEKLEGSHGHIERITVLAVDLVRDCREDCVYSDFVSDNSAKEICEVMGFKTDEKTIKAIKDDMEMDELISTLCRNDRDGFLCEAHYEEPRDIHFREDGTPSAWTCGGVYNVRWVYAHTLAELVEKVIKIGDEIFEKACETAKAEKKEAK
jgi:hypothetical protein